MARSVVWLCLGLALISALSVLAAHHLPGATSPAWQADYTFAFKGPPDAVIEAHQGEASRPLQWGGLIELVRSFLLLLWVGYLFGCVYDRSFLEEVLGLGPSRKGRRRLPLVMISALALVVAALVTVYHLDWGPERLSDDRAKYWDHLREDPRWWGDDWQAEYGEFSRSMGGAEEGDDPELAQLRWKLYGRPYLVYLPYSLINFAIILVPVLGFTFLAGRRAFAQSSRRIHELQETLAGAGSPDQLIGTADRLEEAADLLQRSLRRYSAVLLFWLLGAGYEVLVGYLTLATLAILFAVVGYAAVLVGLIFLFPQIWSYVEARLELQRRLRRAVTMDGRIQVPLTRLNELSLRKLASDDALILLQGTGAAFGFVCTTLGLILNFREVIG